jgi:hypothetical protein
MAAFRTDCPLKSTSEPPVLRDDHQLRKGMSHLGSVVARHALMTIAISVAIGTYLSLPALSSNRPKLSRHAWTSLQPLPSGGDLVPDISIKQLWVQGSWMGALERDIILEAAVIQEALLGQISSSATAPQSEDADSIFREPIDPSKPESDAAEAFIHSPLLYWNDPSALASTDSILDAVNSRTGGKSPANVTLTSISVLSHPAWLGGRLIAADALVVSLFYKVGSRAGVRWDERVEALATTGEGRWDTSFPDAGAIGSNLFKFQSRPVSIQDQALFFTAYALVALMVFVGFRHIRTLRSKVGLLVAIALQVCITL